VEHERNRGGLIWPVILIGAGVVFLLNNMGVLDWGVWNTLLRLWPVLLVAVGLDILIGRRSTLGSALVALLLVVVFVAAIMLGPNWGVRTASLVDRTEQISADLKDAQKAAVNISFGAGSLVLGALPEGSSKLIEGSVDLSKNERLSTDHQGSGSNTRYSIRSNNTWVMGTEVIDQAEDKVWDLDLNRDVPLDLDVNSGVGKTTLDLTSINLTDLQVDGGVGQVTVRLPAEGRYNVGVDGGLGELILIVPEELGVRVRVNGGLGSVSVKGEFERKDREYTTPGFSSAENRAEVDIDGGLGRIEIRRATE
jgi:hypothetical protein